MASTVSEQQHAIVAAALELLAQGGPQALRVRDIAAAAGCTTMTVYSRFGGKDGVVEAIYIDGFTRFKHALERAVDDAPDDDGEGLGMAYRAWALQNPGAYQVMFTEAVPGFVRSDSAALVAADAYSVLVDMVERRQASGHLRDGDPIEIAWTLWGISHGLVMLELAAIRPNSEPVAAEAIFRSALHATVRGLAP